jgi:hypothetical protein
LLRHAHPIKAEYDFEIAYWVEAQEAMLQASGQLPDSWSHNTRKRKLTGGDHLTTVFGREQAGRTWRGDFPAKVRSLPTIETPDSIVLPMSVFRTTAQGATELPNDEGVEPKERLSGILRGLAAHVVGATPSVSYYGQAMTAALAGDAAELLAHFLSVVGRSSSDESEAVLCSRVEAELEDAFAKFRLNGWPTSGFLAICAAAKLASSAPLLRDSLDQMQRGVVPISLEGYAATLRSNGMLTEAAEKAADTLLLRASTLQHALARADSVDEFYDLHIRSLPLLHGAAELIDLAMKRLRDGTAETVHLQRKYNECDEMIARCYTALVSDFKNAVNWSSLDGWRTSYRLFSESDGRFASRLLQKWIYDDKLFPEFWSGYVTGTADNVAWRR